MVKTPRGFKIIEQHQHDNKHVLFFSLNNKRFIVTVRLFFLRFTWRKRIYEFNDFEKAQNFYDRSVMRIFQ